MPQRFRIAWLAFLATILLPRDGLDAAPEPLRFRWLYLMTNLQVDENLAKAELLLDRAAAAGYNGIVLADYKLNVLDRVIPRYFQNLAALKAKADQLGLEVIPCVAPFGYSDGILAHDPNLAEGLPARDVPLRVTGNTARVAMFDKPLLRGGDFEQFREDQVAGWNYQDGPGKSSFVDREVRHGGATSLRFEELARSNAPSGNGRVTAKLPVRAWQPYHASVWIRSAGFSPAGDIHMFAIGKSGRKLSHSNLGVQSDQEWKQHHIVFNSLDADEIQFYVGAWGGRTGKLWIDDVRLEPTAFVNLVRRPGCPLKIASPDGRTFEEGKDFAELRDAKMGTTPWLGNFDVYHEPPQLTLLPGSRIKDGDQLLATFYHAVTVYDNQVPCSLAEPRVFEIVKQQLVEVNKLLAPKRFFFGHDEIRVANWGEESGPSSRPAGQLLAENVRHCVELLQAVNRNAQPCFWSDMFDPNHNAVDNYYLVKGNLVGSWEGLPKDALIINWNSQHPRESLPFFAGRGLHQVLAGYYDGRPDSIRDWIHAGAEVKASGIDGAMYTTWQSRYADLETFARHAWGEKK